MRRRCGVRSLNPELQIKQANMIVGEQIVLFNYRDLHLSPLDSDERQYKSTT